VLPQTWTQIAVVLAAVLPGFVYQLSRRRLAGPDPDEQQLGTRLLRAIAASAVFAGFYVVIWGPALVDVVQDTTYAADHPRAVGLGFLILVVAIPWSVAWVGFALRTSRRWDRVRSNFEAWLEAHVRPRPSWDPTPSAWDFAFTNRQVGWVRVLTPQGWVGGWFGPDSFASTYPDPRELFIQVGYAIDDEGTFMDDVTAPQGVYVRCEDVVTVDFLPAGGDDGTQEAS